MTRPVKAPPAAHPRHPLTQRGDTRQGRKPCAGCLPSGPAGPLSLTEGGESQMAPATDARVRTVAFEFQDTTPNTAKFNEVSVPGQPKVVGRLYVQQWAWEQDGSPARYEMTLTPR